MNSTKRKADDHFLIEETRVTIVPEKSPDLYFFGMMDTDEAGHLNVYTNGRMQENDLVIIKPHNPDQEGEENPDENGYSGRIMSISPNSRPDYTYTYQYGVRCPA